MSFLSVPNLGSSNTSPCVPWEFTGAIPPEVRGKEGKPERDKWITRPTTTHCVYTAFEGMNPTARVSESKGSEEGNPPLRMHAFVADIDEPLTETELQTQIERHMGDLVPNYLERTLSGQVRLIWLFEKPVCFPNSRFAIEFLEHALKQGSFGKLSAQFDKPAWLDPKRMWTNSCDWLVIDAARRIPWSLLQGWVIEVSEKHIWRKDKGAVEIPLPEVLKELEKKWPNHNWPGEFTEGSQGPTFWLEESSSPKSAVVKPTGMFTFSAHAVKPFYSWADLVGIKFVEEYSAKMMGAAVAGIYHDGTTYYRKIGPGEWRGFGKEDVARHLFVDRGLSPLKEGNGPSQVDRAIQFIQNWQGVDGAAPFAFQPHGLLKRAGGTFLNTHTRRVITPAQGEGAWGANGKFPWISRYLDQLFEPQEQLAYFLAWLSRFYKGAYAYEIESGQSLFLLGPPGVGKTFLSQGVLPRLMGGGADAEDFMLGNTTFNSQLFDVALWTIDDNSANVDQTTYRKFSAIVKKMAANTSFAYHAKFRIPCTVDWLGRVVVTANDDEESARIVPDLSISILDKLMLMKTCKVTQIEFPARPVLIQILDNELPYFARFLLDYTPEPQCVGKSRYGVTPYHEKSLLLTAEQSSRSAGFNEILDDWATHYFAEHTEDYWKGNAWQFVKSLHQGDIAVASALRSLTPDIAARHLMSLKAKGWPIETTTERGTRVWKIYRPKTPLPSPLPVSDKFKK